MSPEKNAPALSGMEYAGALLLLLLLLLLPACREEKEKADEPLEFEPDSVVVVPPKGPLFISREGDFSVQLPFGFSLPERSRISTTERTGEVTIYTSEAGEHAVMLAFTRIPGDAEAKGSAELDAARDAALQSVRGTLVHEKPLEYEGHPGRSITFTAPLPSGTTALGRLDCYLIDGRLYEISYLSPTREDFNSADVAVYFESFSLRE